MSDIKRNIAHAAKIAVLFFFYTMNRVAAIASYMARLIKSALQGENRASDNPFGQPVGYNVVFNRLSWGEYKDDQAHHPRTDRQ